MISFGNFIGLIRPLFYELRIPIPRDGPRQSSSIPLKRTTTLKQTTSPMIRRNCQVCRTTMDEISTRPEKTVSVRGVLYPTVDEIELKESERIPAANMFRLIRKRGELLSYLQIHGKYHGKPVLNPIHIYFYIFGNIPYALQ